MVPDPKFRTCEFVESGPGDIMVRQFQGTSHMIVSAHGATTPQAQSWLPPAAEREVACRLGSAPSGDSGQVTDSDAESGHSLNGCEPATLQGGVACRLGTSSPIIKAAPSLSQKKGHSLRAQCRPG
jgi:hypothetical protein